MTMMMMSLSTHLFFLLIRIRCRYIIVMEREKGKTIAPVTTSLTLRPPVRFLHAVKGKRKSAQRTAGGQNPNCPQCGNAGRSRGNEPAITARDPERSSYRSRGPKGLRPMN